MPRFHAGHGGLIPRFRGPAAVVGAGACVLGVALTERLRMRLRPVGPSLRAAPCPEVAVAVKRGAWDSQTLPLCARCGIVISKRCVVMWLRVASAGSLLLCPFYP